MEIPIKMDDLGVSLFSETSTQNLKMMVWKMMFLSKWVIFRFHVNLLGCTLGGGVDHFLCLPLRGGDDPI